MSGFLENTYMPIVQLTLVLPLVIQKFSPFQSGSDGSEETVRSLKRNFIGMSNEYKELLNMLEIIFFPLKNKFFGCLSIWNINIH